MKTKKAFGIILAASLLAGAATVYSSFSLAETSYAAKTVDEIAELDKLYQAALAEGGKLVVYAGGDTPTQQARIEAAFERKFPGIDVDIKVDLSKYHDMRIDNQLERGTLQADIAHLQTIQDFDRWKEEGVLMQYKPLGWDMVYPQFKDKDGYFTALNVIAFSNVVHNQIPDSEAPRDAINYLEPKYKGKLVFTYPNDDDAVLYQFKQIIDKYGWEYMDKLLAQEPQFVRGTAAASRIVASGEKLATFTASSPLVPFPGSTTRLVLPEDDSFLSWPQTAAIFKGAEHPAAAKLYMSWWLSKETQEKVWVLWPARKDVTVPGGYESIYQYNTAPEAFRDFMHDRAALERFRGQIELYVGAPQGPSPTAGTWTTVQ